MHSGLSGPQTCLPTEVKNEMPPNRSARKTLIALAVVAITASVNVRAEVSDEEIHLLREQIQALSQRLDQLEQANRELKAANDKLLQTSLNNAETGAEVHEKAAIARVSEPPAEASWTETIHWKGDFRFRYENIDVDGKDDRNRSRIRARAALVADVNDTMEVGLGWASGGDDPVSSNQTLGKGGSTKDIGLDLAYFDWSGLNDTHVMGGKFKNILYRPSRNQMLWDSDWRPEGTGIAWDNGHFFASALGTWIESDSSIGNEFSYLTQLGFRLELGDNARLTAGIGYHQFDTAGKGSFFGDDNDFFGNSFDPVTNTYLYDYEGVQLFAELGFRVFDMPATVFADYVQNQAVDEFDSGYNFGLKLGSARAPGSWDLSWAWEDLETDAALGLLTDSDFGGGGTNAKGHILKGTYAIAENFNTIFTYFINEIDGNRGKENDFNRLQLDLNFKY